MGQAGDGGGQEAAGVEESKQPSVSKAVMRIQHDGCRGERE